MVGPGTSPLRLSTSISSQMLPKTLPWYHPTLPRPTDRQKAAAPPRPGPSTADHVRTGTEARTAPTA